ncbi:MAG TPA: iron chelate uptake ABC transporter family permease subunit, partial [Acidimicrobiales bacterium]|nr:iron chelate uptake ABC transporter family permease subunit [Acidimicrobiales bacterium]
MTTVVAPTGEPTAGSTHSSGWIRAARRAESVRARRVSVVLAVVGVVAFCVSLSVGDFPIPLADVVPALVGLGTDDAEFIVGTLRLPRALAAVLVGAAFGVSGAIFQALARNPLASPDIIGITAGASTAAVALIVLASAPAVVVSLGSFAGALATATAIYLLAWRQGVSAYRLVLVGAAFGVSGAIFQALARNPLASPDLIGITAGASTAAVALIVLASAPAVVVSLGSFAGALATATAIYLLAWRQGVSAYRLVLVGIGLGAMLASITSYLLT